MKITGTAIKLGAFSLVLLMFTAIIIIVFGQVRFDRHGTKQLLLEYADLKLLS